MNDFFFPANSCGVLLLKLVQAILLFKHVLDEPATAICHLTKSVLKTCGQPSCVRVISVCFVRQVPHVVSDELFHSFDLRKRDQVFLQTAEAGRQTLDVFDEDVVASYHDLLRGRRCLVCLAARILRLRDRLNSSTSSVSLHRISILCFKSFADERLRSTVWCNLSHLSSSISCRSSFQRVLG